MTNEEAIAIEHEITRMLVATVKEEHKERVFTAHKMAIEALEKQIPQKPTYTGEKNVYGGIVRICKECGDKVCISPMAKEYENYCRSCGKRLTDWSDTDE